jgi:hypothetical protein
MHGLVTTLLDAVNRAGIRYCLLRDAERLEDLACGGEIDLLVEREDLQRLGTLLTEAGFVHLPSRGFAPHIFFVRYDLQQDAWLKCDVVTEVAYGWPVHNLRTDLGASCLANRERVPEAFAPAPDDELIALLLHCILDKRHFSPARIGRVKVLRQRISRDDRISAHLERYWSTTMTWGTLAELIDQDAWASLLAERQRVVAMLARRDSVGTIARGIHDRVLRRLRPWLAVATPYAPSVALLAPDGAGKSTLADGIQRRFFSTVCSVYMGLYQDRPRRAARSRVPGLGFVRQVFTQWRRYLGARYRQAAGQLVIFDRYTYDALLPSQTELNRVRRVRRWLLAHSCPAPDLVIILDAPGHVLYARKQEHNADVLEEQRQSYLRMRSSLSRVAVVDATCDSDQVRRAVTALVWDEYRTKLGRQKVRFN